MIGPEPPGAAATPAAHPHGRDDERGLMSTELAILMLAFIFSCTAIVILAGRRAQLEGEVQSAAEEAARAATLTGDPGTAVAVATSVAQTNLTAAGIVCDAPPVITVDVSGFAPGDYVTVSVTCTANLNDLAYLRVPAGASTATGEATEIIDVYRSDTP